MADSEAMTVPFNRPYTGANAVAYLAEALSSSHHSGDGPWTHSVSAQLSDMLGSSRVFATPSGTDALELAAMAAGIEPGDEVIVPSFTFSSAATASERQGATLRFADIREDTLGLDISTIDHLVTPRTRSIVAVHYAGQAADLEQLVEYCEQRGITLIEDAAHSLGAEWNDRPLGTFGTFGCFSFHETKNLSCGEGGALAVNDSRLVESVEIMREKGTNRSRFFRGQVDKYTWVSPGSSFLLSDLLAAMLAAGLDDWDITQATRRHTWQRYQTELRSFCAEHGFTQPTEIPKNTNPHHIYYLLAPIGSDRDALLAHCRANGVLAVSHYQPLATSEEGRRAARGFSDPCPVSESVAERLIRLPLFSSITDTEVNRVIDVVRAWR